MYYTENDKFTDLFKNIDFSIYIQISNLLENDACDETLFNDAKKLNYEQIKDITYSVYEKIYIDTDEEEITSSELDYNELSVNELNMPAYLENTITFYNAMCDFKKTYKTDKGYFTIKEIIENIINFEKKVREKNPWLGCIDTHHNFFEGLFENNNKFEIAWGS